MCKLGDIIVIKEFKNEIGERISQHSFVVIDDEKNYIQGIKYDFVANMLCSFHSKKHKRRKLKYKENFYIKENLILGEKINNKDGFIKADQLYFFDKNKIKYKVIAHIDDDLFKELINLIFILNQKSLLKIIITNVKKT